MADGPDNLAARAAVYLAAGLSVLPAHRNGNEKHIALRTWKPYQRRLPTPNEVQAWFSNAHQSLCLVCGSGSGNLEVLDFDVGGEAFEPWCRLVRDAAPGLLERLVIETTPSGGRHAAYRAAGVVSGSMKLSQRKLPVASGDPVVVCGKTYVPRKDADGNWYVLLTNIETRGEGGLFLCAPSDGYQLVQGDFTALPILSAEERETLLSSAWVLNEVVPVPEPVRVSGGAGTKPGDDYSARGDMRAVLQKHGWTLAKPGENEYWCRPGKTAGTSATLKNRVFYVFSSNATPFEPNKAYSPFAVYALLENAGNYADAAGALRREGYGGDASDPAVDISGIVAASVAVDDAPPADPEPAEADPIPDRLIRVPGFIAETAEHSYATAKYGQPSLSFAGALVLQAFLAGRKIRDESDVRTNLYVLSLANSGVGKEHPRQVNQQILLEAGLDDCFGEHFASGEGIEDRLLTAPAMLFQTDEIDALVLAIATGHDPRWEGIMSVLLRFYSNTSAIYPMRVKAGQSAGTIDQPHLCLLGTAIPKNYYQAMSAKMLTNGFFARMIVMESGPRQRGGGKVRLPIPPRLVQTARWWVDFQPGRSGGNLRAWHPEPAWVESAPGSEEALEALRDEADAEYKKAERAGEVATMAVWARAYEKARKLALIYAASECPQNPKVSVAGATWASEFILFLTRQMLAQAGRHMAETEFHAKCNRMVEVLMAWRRQNGSEWMPFWRINRKLPWSQREHDDVRITLENMKRIEYHEETTGGTPKRLYKLR